MGRHPLRGARPVGVWAAVDLEPAIVAMVGDKTITAGLASEAEIERRLSNGVPVGLASPGRRSSRSGPRPRSRGTPSRPADRHGSMRTKKIGSLDVTVVGLGTNNFGFGMEADAVGPGGRPGHRSRGQLLRHRRQLPRKRGADRPGVEGPPRPGDPRDEVRQPDGRGEGRRQRRVRAAGGRAQPAKLDTDHIDLYQLHRPDPNTPIAETLGRARRAGGARARSARSAARTSPPRCSGRRGGGRPGRCAEVRERAEPLQPAAPRRRARGDPRVRGARHRLSPLLPAGERPAHRASTRAARRHRRAPACSAGGIAPPAA